MLFAGHIRQGSASFNYLFAHYPTPSIYKSQTADGNSQYGILKDNRYQDICFRAKTNRLLPLYEVNLFALLSVSQCQCKTPSVFTSNYL